MGGSLILERHLLGLRGTADQLEVSSRRICWSHIHLTAEDPSLALTPMPAVANVMTRNIWSTIAL